MYYDEICQVENCWNEARYIERGMYYSFCSEHKNYHSKCQEENCSRFIVSYLDYCSLHSSSCSQCGIRLEASRGCCDNCTGGKCEFCHREINKIEKKENGGYCSFHKERCYCYQTSTSQGCNQRVEKWGNYCDNHKNQCRFPNCKWRIYYNSTYCSGQNHGWEEEVEFYKTQFDRERNKTDGLQNKLNVIQTNLGIDNLNNLETELKNSVGEMWSLTKWKEELEIEKGKTKIIDNFYRRQFILNNDLDGVRNELSRQILEVNRENRQIIQEISDLREVISNLENLTIQDEDVFLFEKIDNKRGQLEQLKVDIRNRLNQNFHDTLEDILENQKALVQSNFDNNFIQNQLERFKQRLLGSGQITQIDLNKICQTKAELSFLELKLEQEQKFQAQIEINRNN